MAPVEPVLFATPSERQGNHVVAVVDDATGKGKLKDGQLDVAWRQLCHAANIVNGGRARTERRRDCVARVSVAFQHGFYCDFRRMIDGVLEPGSAVYEAQQRGQFIENVIARGDHARAGSNQAIGTFRARIHGMAGNGKHLTTLVGGHAGCG